MTGRGQLSAWYERQRSTLWKDRLDQLSGMIDWSQLSSITGRGQLFGMIEWGQLCGMTGLSGMIDWGQLSGMTRPGQLSGMIEGVNSLWFS